MTASPVWESQILDIAVRPASRQSMARVTSSIAAVGGSLEGDHGSSRQRGITFLAGVYGEVLQGGRLRVGDAVRCEA